MKHRIFDNYKTYSMELAGRTLTVETGKMAELANAAVFVRYGETAVLVTATASQTAREGIDYFPLSVDFDERLYAVGRIPGSFMRREGRPGEKAILASRVIDRPLRPLFPKDMRNDVAICATVMSVDHDCSPEVCAMIGASIALSISDIPWNGPVGSVIVGYVDGNYVINPTSEQKERSQMYVTVAGTRDKIAMIEAAAKQIPNDVMFGGIMAAHEEIKKIVKFTDDIVAEIGKPKFEYAKAAFDEELYHEIKDNNMDKMRYCLDTDDKNVREERLNVLRAELHEQYLEKYPEMDKYLEEIFYKMQKEIVRRWLLDDEKRVDGRGLYEVRPLAAEVGLLPRVHGSALFTRGQTQVLSIATLGTFADSQKLDTIYEEEEKRYIHHYNFPSWSVGEARPSKSPGRREIGHGALAEKALDPVIPSEEEFPYAIRVVSEVLSSNGSTSQGSVCGSTLALMDAGVPISAPVAGISCGLVTEGDRWITFTDIQGVEDFYGDMDFKVAGTKAGITAIQVDIKIDGLTPEIIKSAFDLTYTARCQILDEIMLPCLAAPRADLSKYAPKMVQTQIDVDKIRDVIGKGGSVIQKICADTNAKIDIEDDGRVFIAAQNRDDCNAALKIVQAIVNDPVVGDMFDGKVTRIMSFGAFVEFAPGKEGLVHISKLADHRVEKCEDVVKIGDSVKVKVIEIDDKGRINLSMKDAKEKAPETQAE